ncbi:MAG: hypothetical protein ACTSU5_15715 [Promethearchaeota archaeon]
MGTTGHVVEWVVEVTSGSWISGQPITISVDDGLGGSAEDVVYVIVTSSAPSLDIPGYSPLVLVLSCGVVVTALSRRRHDRR